MEGFEPALSKTIVYYYCILANWQPEETVAQLRGAIVALPGSGELKLRSPGFTWSKSFICN